MIKGLLSLSLLLVSAWLNATVIAPHPILVPAPFMETQKGEAPIQLQSLSINADISGSMAQTRIRMVFFNPNKRNLEGELQFPLMDGQEITGFALDINGTLRAAVPVEKAKGRQIFEDVERRSVDPALLEKTQGNNFKLRVYPIAAGGTRTVELIYSETLARSASNLKYRLPLNYGNQLKEFDLTISAHGFTEAPVASGTITSSAMSDISFTKLKNEYSAHFSKSNLNLQGDLTLFVPASTEPKTYVQTFGDSTYFVTEIPINSERSPRALPKILGLLWDASGSGSARATDAEIILLDTYFKSVKNAEVRLTKLRDHREPTKIFKINNGNWDELRKELQTTIYDGATNLSDWQAQVDVNEYLLFSDGLSNYGNTAFPSLAQHQSLYTFSSAVSADTTKLSALAEKNNGKFIPIDSTQPKSAADTLLSGSTKITKALSVGVSDLLFDASHLEQGYLRIAGKLTNPTAEINLTLKNQNEKREYLIRVSTQNATNPLTANLWASFKLRQLESDYELHRAEIRRIGLAFSVPTRETSLLVLDSVNDYLKYDVTPPSELLVEFTKLKSAIAQTDSLSRQKQIDQVVQQFEEKIKWWEKVFPKDPIHSATAKEKSDVQALNRSARNGVVYLQPMVESPAPALSMEVAPMADSAPAPVAAPAAPRHVAKKAENGLTSNAESEGTQVVLQASITLKKWSSDAPYISRMNKATKENIYAIYLDEKPSYANSSAFYLDVADALFDKGLPDLGLRVLSNIAEMNLENTALLRILGYRLMQANATTQAIPIFEKVQLLTPDEPQSFRDLGLAYAAQKNYQLAIDQFNEVIQRAWDGRFADIEAITLAEMNSVIAEAQRQNIKLDTQKIDPRLIRNLPLDVRAVLTWDANDSDMDLWVTDPNNEKCFYGHKDTYQGGRMSRDFTQGYGPEEFSLRVAKPGKYKVEANFYGNRQQVVAGATTLQLKLTTGFGTKNAKDQMITLRLKDRGETVFVGEFEVK